MSVINIADVREASIKRELEQLADHAHRVLMEFENILVRVSELSPEAFRTLGLVAKTAKAKGWVKAETTTPNNLCFVASLCLDGMSMRQAEEP